MYFLVNGVEKWEYYNNLISITLSH